METITRNSALLLLELSLTFLCACGTTAIVESHPSLARPGDSNAAKVYFMRPDIGYHGVARIAFSISLNDEDLLTLAVGEYALVYLEPVSGVVTVESWTVNNENGQNVMAKARESRFFSFDAGKTSYLAFQDPNQARWTGLSDLLVSALADVVSPTRAGISFAPTPITAAEAIEAASRTRPVGNALQEPIAQSGRQLDADP